MTAIPYLAAGAAVAGLLLAFYFSNYVRNAPEGTDLMKEIAASIRDGLGDAIATLEQQGVTPGLATVLMNDNPDSETYVSMKQRTCEELVAAYTAWRDDLQVAFDLEALRAPVPLPRSRPSPRRRRRLPAV